MGARPRGKDAYERVYMLGTIYVRRSDAQRLRWLVGTRVDDFGSVLNFCELIVLG